MTAIDLSQPVDGSPEWWLRTLLAQLEARRPDLVLWNDYYENRHPMNFFDAAIRDRFGGRFARFASNFSALVVDGLAERYEVLGFRFSDPQGDEDVWSLWQDNNLDANSETAHIEAFVKGCAYTLVDPNAGDPLITVEDPFDTIVAHDPRDARRRLAALKRWIEPSSAKLVIVVYLPDAIYKYRSVQSWPNNSGTWLSPNIGFQGPTWTVNSPEPGDATVNPPSGLRPASIDVPAGGFEPYQPAGDAEWPLPNSLRVVPVIRLANRPRVNGEFRDGRSEIQPIASNQDLINYYRAMSVVAARYLAMPQRYALNLDTETDPTTGQPKSPFRGGLADLWVVPPMGEDDPRALQAASQVVLGQFAAADLSPYIELIDREVKAIAAITRMPYTYLMDTTSTPPTGESITAAEASLVRKVRNGRVHIGEGWEETMRVALLAKGDEKRSKQNDAETIWASPQTMNLAVVTDAAVKLRHEGIIDDDTARDWIGLTPQQQRRVRANKPQVIPMIREQLGGTGGLSAELPDEGVTLPATAKALPAAQGSQPVAMATRPRNT